MRALLFPTPAFRLARQTAVALTLTIGGWTVGRTQDVLLRTGPATAVTLVPAVVGPRSHPTLAPAAPASVAPTAVGSAARTIGTLGPGRSRAERLAEAERLHRRALGLGQELRLREAAAWHLRAAALRSEGDSLTYRCREQAGALLDAAGDLVGARTTLSRAAASAQAHGRTADAADGYIKAGLVAKAQGDFAGESVFARQAADLLTSPTLTATQRERISARISRPVPAEADTAGHR